MPKSTIYAPYSKTPSVKSGSRIRIPQPPYRSIQLKKLSSLKSGIKTVIPEWFSLHLRGPRRALLGIDPNEMRAVPKSSVTGSLPERIVYKELMRFGFLPDADFDFQSAWEGGRSELGGLMADFLFRNLRFVLQVQGPGHEKFLQSIRDDQQRMIFADYGYTVEWITMDEVLDANRCEDKLRRLFGLPRGSGMVGSSFALLGDMDDVDVMQWDSVIVKIKNLISVVEEMH